MLCSLYQLAKNIEGILYDVTTVQNEKKQEYYDKMLLTSPEQIFATININLPDTYLYNKDTTVMVIDNVSKSRYTYKIPHDELENINKLSRLARGTYINDLIFLEK
jgi:hypothetical protein